MPHELFLSHDSRDRVKADVLASTITRVTLRQIVVWHSSDTSPSGGIRPGSVWLDEIRTRLSRCKAVVVLLTPISVSRPWLLFESGFGAAQADCDVIPVCVGIDSATEVPYPLAMYQTYQLSDYESLKHFAEKLFVNYNIPFDEQMSRAVLEDAIKQLSQAPGSIALPPKKNPTISEAIAELKEHIDKRIISMMGERAGGESSSSPSPRYNVAIDVPLPSGQASTQFVEVGEETSVQDVLNRIYFMLMDRIIDPYKYLEQWVLRDKMTGEHLIVREIQYRIPAKTIFAPGSKWEVLYLLKAYSATDRLSEMVAKPHPTKN